MTRNYKAPGRLDGETSEQWCNRYVASIPAEEFLAEILHVMHLKRKRRGPVWSQIGYYTGHGSGVSSAIVKRFMHNPDEDDVR